MPAVKRKIPASTESLVRRAEEFHGHLGPFLAIGVRMGQAALETLDAKEHKGMLRISLKVPFRVPYSCVIDGVQTSTGCTVGNQRLLVVNAEEIKAKIEDLSNRQSMTIAPQLNVLAVLKEQVIAKASAQEEIRRLAWNIAAMPTKALLTVKKQGKKREPMRDLEIAKNQLQRKNYSLVVVREGKVIFKTKQSGIGGFLSAIDQLGRTGLRGSAIADKVVGRAAALLCVYCGVKDVYAIVASKGGREVLRKHGVPLESESLVPSILNWQQTGTCPFEKIVATTSDAEEAYEKLKSCIKEIKKR